MDQAHAARERRGQQLARRRAIVADALALAQRHRERALAWGNARLVARYDAVILRAEGALATLDAALAAEAQP